MSDYTKGSLRLWSKNPRKIIQGDGTHKVKQICDCWLYQGTHGRAKVERKEAEANAERIVQCWNAHDELLEALVAITKTVGEMTANMKDDPPQIFGDLMEANAAIAKAKGKSDV